MSKNRVLTDDPRQTILWRGIYSISDAETLSVIIGGRNPVEKAKNVLARVNGSYIDLAKLSYNELIHEGLTYTQAVRFIAANGYSQRKATQVAEEKQQIKSSKDVFDIFLPIMQDLVHEEFWILFLNRSNKIIGKMKLSQGGISGTVTDVRIIMKKAIEFLSSGVIICHNHPSGNLQPSEADTRITQKIKESGSIMDIQLLDHLIISDKEYYSFADNGLM